MFRIAMLLPWFLYIWTIAIYYIYNTHGNIGLIQVHHTVVNAVSRCFVWVNNFGENTNKVDKIAVEEPA